MASPCDHRCTEDENEEIVDIDRDEVTIHCEERCMNCSNTVRYLSRKYKLVEEEEREE